MKKKLFWTVFLVVIFGSNAQNPTESLSSLDSLLYKKRCFNKTQKMGHCIQLYNGSEKKAVETMAKFREDFPDLKVFRTYKVPEWKIRTEHYKTRLEADRVLNQIKKKYPEARVL